MLTWLGMREGDIAELFVIQGGVIAVAGVAVGIIAAVCLPSFLPQELIETSVFMLPIPWGIVAVSAVLSMFASLLALSLPALIRAAYSVGSN